jgi:hypothetical protein
MSKGNRNRQHRQSSPGYTLNSTERKKLNDEVKRAVLRQSQIMSVEADAAWVLMLYNELDLSVEECYRLYKQIEVNHAELREFYEVNPLDGMGWLYVQKCKDAGMDIEKWSKETPG